MYIFKHIHTYIYTYMTFAVLIFVYIYENHIFTYIGYKYTHLHPWLLHLFSHMPHFSNAEKTFSKVSATVIVYTKLSSNLTFENVSPVFFSFLNMPSFSVQGGVDSQDSSSSPSQVISRKRTL